MIQYKSFEFACPPGVGGLWFCMVSRQLGLGPAYDKRVCEPFPKNHNGLLRVTIVRSPFDWLHYYWASGMEVASYLGQFASIDRDGTFEDLINRYLCSQARVWKVYEQFQADTVLRIEDMPQAFCEFARSMGVSKVQLQGFQRIPPTYSFKLSRKHRQLILEAERDICDRYDYV